MVQKIKNTVHGIQALAGHVWYGFPSKKLRLIGVTGTDGKTTTSNLIYHLLNASGMKSGLVSTINARIGDETIDTGLHVTTPDPWDVPKLIDKAQKAGCKAMVMEVSSHGLDQNRVLGCNFEIGVHTTITHEHIDYHKTFDNYLGAKAKLFQRAKVAILNKDDSSYAQIKQLIPSDKKIITYAIDQNADLMLKDFPFTTSMPGKYNQYNCLGAIAVARYMGVSDSAIKKGLASFKGIPGRFEIIPNKKQLHVVIDFAHKPNALENVLKTAKKLYPKGKIIAVYGAAGERDYLKRPMMGTISGTLADISILTAEDPRSENENDIIESIAKGCLEAGAIELKTEDLKHTEKTHTFIRIPDRKEAIFFALRKAAQKGDTVLLLGKGHEESMCYGKTEKPWNEHATVAQALSS